MNLSTLTERELVELIAKASAELASRLDQPDVKRIPTPRTVVVMREPPEDDKDFVLLIKGMLAKGGYIRAAERRRVAEIAAEYPEWVRRQGLPSGSGTGEWKNAGAFHSAPRARER